MPFHGRAPVVSGARATLQATDARRLSVLRESDNRTAIIRIRPPAPSAADEAYLEHVAVGSSSTCGEDSHMCITCQCSLIAPFRCRRKISCPITEHVGFPAGHLLRCGATILNLLAKKRAPARHPNMVIRPAAHRCFAGPSELIPQPATHRLSVRGALVAMAQRIGSPPSAAQNNKRILR